MEDGADVAGIALSGWTTAVGKKMVESMTVGSATVEPRTIVSAIGGRTDDGMFTSTRAVCDKSVTFSNSPCLGCIPEDDREICRWFPWKLSIAILPVI